MPIHFEHPGWLLLLLLLIPTAWIAFRGTSGVGAVFGGRVKAAAVFLFRTCVIVLLAMALAEPSWVKEGEGVTTTIILDRSDSIPLPLKRESQEFFEAASEHNRRPQDRVAVITVAKDAAITGMPNKYTQVNTNIEPADLSATNLAAAVRLALAIMPEDTANRIVIASDGNETVDSVLAASEVATANDIPVDVFVLEYEHEQEVLFDRIIAPSQARVGQSVNLKMVLRAQQSTSGVIHLTMNDEPLDMNGPDEPGVGMRIELEPGPRVIPVTLSMDQSGPQRFEATFTPDDAAVDAVIQNNRAVAVTFVGSEGKVLILEMDPSESEYLVAALADTEVEVVRMQPQELSGGLVAMTGFDAIVLCNTPRFAFDEQQVKDLHAYVHDLGGGLVMTGGDQSFGAGQWIDSDVAKVLPVRLDPPQSRQMPRGALALIMHSCEMAQGNFWGQKVAESAIQSLSRLDYAGIVTYGGGWGGGAGGIGGCKWAYPMQIVGDKQAAFAAIKQMTVGDMPAFAPSMQLAVKGLKEQAARAGQKHAIIISDGDPAAPSAALLQEYIDAKVTITTIMVGGHGTQGHRNSMKETAEKTGGRFYNILNPKKLPAIFIKEAQLVSRRLIQEGRYQPQIASRLPGPTEGFASVPPIDGYVLAAPREGLAQVPIINATTEGNDPIYAFWNYGLGKSIAYTSDVSNTWGADWVGWARFNAFWEQSIRWVMRQSSPRNLLLETRLEGDKAIVELEALGADASFVNFLNFAKTQTVVLRPDGTPQPLALQQIGPGHYRGEFDIDDAGAYLVNVNYSGQQDGRAMGGNVQAAASVPYAREFRAVKHNAATLKQLAKRTEGREIIKPLTGDPTLVNLFEREALPTPRSLKDVWDLLVIIAASLFVLDVAARRLSIDPKWIRDRFKWAVGSRGEAGTDTVAAWKKAKSGVAHRADDAQRKREQAQRGVKFEAEEGAGEYGLDIEGGSAAGDKRAAELRVKRQETTPEVEDEDSMTSRLLAAKRRAAEQTDQTKRGDDG